MQKVKLRLVGFRFDVTMFSTLSTLADYKLQSKSVTPVNGKQLQIIPTSLESFGKLSNAGLR